MKEYTYTEVLDLLERLIDKASKEGPGSVEVLELHEPEHRTWCIREGKK